MGVRCVVVGGGGVYWRSWRGVGGRVCGRGVGRWDGVGGRGRAEEAGEEADGEVVREGCERAEEEVEGVLGEDGEVGDGGGGGEGGGEGLDGGPG